MMSITPTQHDHNLDAVRGVLILSAGSCSAIWMLRQMLFFIFFLPYSCNYKIPLHNFRAPSSCKSAIYDNI